MRHSKSRKHAQRHLQHQSREGSGTFARSAAIGWSFSISILASVALAVVYALGGQTQLIGLCLAVALGGIASGLIVWSNRLLPQDLVEQHREVLRSNPTERREAEQTFAEGAHEIERRSFLSKLLGAAIATLGATAVFPIRSLGSRPGVSLFHTSWSAGIRAVTPDGIPVQAKDLLENAIVTVFPEGHLDAADSQVVLIKMPEGSLEPRKGRETWAPSNIIGFSKLCTHAGCPVGLFQAATAELNCPCHQSVFSVSNAAAPTQGPATRALPQLPLAIDSQGYIIAQSDFLEPVGAAFWNMRG